MTTPAVFTPDNEPYLGRTSVFQFDQIIEALMEQQHRIAARTRLAGLDRLQLAASELAPGACSIGLAIRELVRQGYLFPALVLLRPLIERVAVLAYLADHHDSLDDWEAGWSYRTRPKFKDLLASLKAEESGDDVLDEASLVATHYHELVHGGPDAAGATLVRFPGGHAGFTVSKDLDSPDRADAVSFEATMYLVVLMSTLNRVFEES